MKIFFKAFFADVVNTFATNYFKYIASQYLGLDFRVTDHIETLFEYIHH